MAENDTSSLTPKGRMEAVEKILDEYETALGLPRFQEDYVGESEVTTYIEMDRRSMEKLTLEDCAEIAIALDQFAFHLQRAVNRENARVNWATDLLKEMISGRECQYQGSWDSQFHQAVKGDAFTRQVAKIQRYAQQRSDRITYLANAVRNRSNLFINLQKAKVMKG